MSEALRGQKVSLYFLSWLDSYKGEESLNIQQLFKF